MSVKKTKSALRVSEGIEQPSAVNQNAIEKYKKNRRTVGNAEELFNAIRSGDITSLSRAITLVESSLPEHQIVAQEIIERCLPFSGNSLRLGITGVPGAGKSTFIEVFGNYLITKKHKIAVLAIDPSSKRTGGSILGDKTRMETLAGNRNAYIRPSPSGGELGGVARKTRETVILCEAAGYDINIIETVGVGQSETTVQSMVDFFLLVLIPGAGDELQGMKRGIMEMADAIIINKADGDNIDRANRSMTEYSNALHLFPLPLSGWTPKVRTCSALEGSGINEVWNMIEEYRRFTSENGFFSKRRAEQNTFWMYQTLSEGLKRRFYDDPKINARLKELEKMIEDDKISSFVAAAKLLEDYFDK